MAAGDTAGGRCFACTHPQSSALTEHYFCRPEMSAIAFHVSCFADFSAWMETRRNLGRLVSAWAFHSRWVRHHHTWKVLRLVRKWQRRDWAEWTEALRANSCCRRPFAMWAQLTGITVPNLVESSEEDIILHELVDSSEEEPDWLVKLIDLVWRDTTR